MTKKTPPPPAPPSLHIDLFQLNSTQEEWDVSGASGNLLTAPNAQSIVLEVSGGTPPYSNNITIANEGGVGAVSLVTVGSHLTVAWAGLNSVGDFVAFHLNDVTTDNVSATAAARFPTSVAESILIRRTS